MRGGTISDNNRGVRDREEERDPIYVQMQKKRETRGLNETFWNVQLDKDCLEQT